MTTTTALPLRFRLPDAAATVRPDRRPLLCALVFIAALTALRIGYLANDPPLELAQDEAHYWDWSRHLDWSYYSKGPLVAWLIRLSCAACGGDTLLAVRLPAVCCGALTLLGLYILTLRAYSRPWLAFAAVALSGALPLFHVGSLLMTIDAPYVCAWTWAVALGLELAVRQPPAALDRRGEVGGRPGAADGRWALLGLIVGLGILAKYTMVLFIPALGLHCLLSKDARGWFRRPGPYVMAAVAALCCTPILVWNMRNGWVTLRHVGGQAGLAAEFGKEPTASILWLGPLDYLGGQFALLLGFGFVIWCLALRRALKVARSQAGEREPRSAAAERYLTAMSLVPFLVFLVFSLKTKIQLNWPIAAYLAGLPLCVKWLADHWAALAGWKGRLFRGGVAFAMLAGFALSVLLHRTEWLYPALAPFADKLPARRWDPTCRLRGWSRLAVEVERVRTKLRAEGVEPILAGAVWYLPGEIAFHLPDQPQVFCLGQLAGDRQSQYDFWPPHPAHDPKAFAGKTFIVVGWAPKQLWTHFDRIEPTTMVTHVVAGQAVASWPITVARGFRGESD